MGWHYILFFRCKVLPEFIDFIKNKYIWNDCDECSYNDYDCTHIPTFEGLSKSYQDLVDIWYDLKISNHYYEYDIDENNIFTCKISKKVGSHEGELWSDFEHFLKDIIVPISEEIMECKIESDDYGDRVQIYTDMELRGQSFNLKNMIKLVEHIWEDGEIVGTKLIYKRSVKSNKEVDLNRLYTKY